MAPGISEDERNGARRLQPGMTAEEVRKLSPLTLAYIGDAVYELYVREQIIRTGEMSPGKMNRAAVGKVRAEAQAALVEELEPLFTEEEAAVYHRGRNAKSHTHAKHASLAEYHRATGLEAVLGYLYLLGEDERIWKLLGWTRGSDETN